MRFLGDRRAQSIQIGAILLFGFLIVALSLYQAQVVPEDNRQVEFDHSQDVENDMVDLRNAVRRAGSLGGTQPTSVRLGTRYPQRTFFVNPPPASGTIRSVDSGELRIENADPSGKENFERYWNDREAQFETRSLRYSPRYNEYQEAPDLTYEHSTVVAEFDGATRLRSDQTVIRDKRISLVAVTGDLSETAVEPRSVDLDAVSQSTRTVSVSGEDGDPLELVLPTAVGEEREDDLEAAWEERIRSQHLEELTVEDGAVTIRLDGSQTYQLRLAEVSLDDDEGTDPQYVVPISGENVLTGQTFGVEVRDRYNNPVEGADVAVDGCGLTDARTDENGQVTWTCDDPGTVEASIGDDEQYETVEFTVIQAEGGEGVTNYDVDWDGSETAAVNDGVTYDASENRLTIDRAETGTTIQMFGSVSAGGNALTGAGIDFATTAPEVAGFPSGSSLSDEGSFDTTLDVSESAGDARLFTAAGDDTDEIEVEVFGDPGEAEPEIRMRVDDLTDRDQDDPRFYVSYDVEGSYDEVEITADLTEGTASDSTTSDQRRNGVDLAPGNGESAEFDITIDVIEDGQTIDSRTITTDADTDNPAENDDLARGDSSTLQSAVFDDRSNQGQGARYDIDWTVSSEGSFSEVQLHALNRGDGNDGSVSQDGLGRTGSERLNPYNGWETEYKLGVLVVDDDGVVVDDEIVIDTADGDDP